MIPGAVEVDPAAFAAIIAAVLGTGGLGAFLTFRRANKEADKIGIDSLIAVNGELRRELDRRDGEIRELRDRLVKEVTVRDLEITMLKERIDKLEEPK